MKKKDSKLIAFILILNLAFVIFYIKSDKKIFEQNFSSEFAIDPDEVEKYKNSDASLLKNITSGSVDFPVSADVLEKYVVATFDVLNLRAEPNTDSEILLQLNGEASGEPDTVYVIEKFVDEGPWWQILFEDGEQKIVGYIFNEEEYLSKDWSFDSFYVDDQNGFNKATSFNCGLNEDPNSNKYLEDFYFFKNLYKNIGSKALLNGTLLIKENTNKYKVQSRFHDDFDGISTVEINESIEIKDEDTLPIQDAFISLNLETDENNVFQNQILISDVYSIDKNEKAKVKTYRCCQDSSCSSYIKLIPEDKDATNLYIDLQKENLAVKKIMVSSSPNKPELNFLLSSNKPPEKDEESIAKAYQEYLDSKTYTNLKEVFLGRASLPSRGGKTLYQLKTISDAPGTEKPGPCGSFNYNPETLGGIPGGDRFIDPDVLSCFLATLQVFQKANKGHIVQWGDISRGDTVKFPGHSTHQKGIDIDVRPLRNDGKTGALLYTSSVYDHAKTKEFLKIAAKFGAKPIYFNDPKIAKDLGVVRTAKGHDNHFHLIYSRTCTNVILEEDYCPRAGFEDKE